MKNVLSFLSLLAVTILFFIGCDKLSPALEGNWLVGTWVLDRETTMLAFSKNHQKETPSGGLVGGIAAAAIRETVDALIKPMENIQLTFSSKEITESAPGYQGEPKTYQIVERPGPNQIKILDSNDSVRIYHREGEKIWYHLGNQRFQIYLKPFVQ